MIIRMQTWWGKGPSNVPYPKVLAIDAAIHAAGSNWHVTLSGEGLQFVGGWGSRG